MRGLGLRVDDVLAVLDQGETIEHYEHRRGRLVLGWWGDTAVHVSEVADEALGVTLITTVYRPDPDRWTDFSREETMMDEMTCPMCSLGGRLGSEVVTEAKGHKGHTVVIHDVPAYVCDRCGTRVFSEATTRALEDVYVHAANDHAELYVVRYGALEPAG